jgi:DNA-binding response OmpR family regulator
MLAAVSVPFARIELLGTEGPIRDAVYAAVHDGGWACEMIDWRDLSRIERENWNLIVIGAERVTSELLLGSANASRDPLTRVMVVCPDREPQLIADVLRSGADDYLVYPFLAEECRARIRSLVEFSLSIPQRRRFGYLAFDFPARAVIDGAARVSLSPGEWDVLLALLDADGDPVGLAELAEHVRPEPGNVVSLASTISRLRRKLREGGIDGLDIDTISGRGYAIQRRRQRASR